MQIRPSSSATTVEGVSGLPPASASSRRAAILGAASGVLGLYLSYYAGIASGAAVVLVATGFFFVVLLVAPRRRRFLGRRESQTTG